MSAKIRDVTTKLAMEMELPYANADNCFVGRPLFALATRSHTRKSKEGVDH
jgi:hypothetical protein